MSVFLIQNELSALGVDVFYVQVAFGVVLLVAVVAGSSLGRTAPAPKGGTG